MSKIDKIRNEIQESVKKPIVDEDVPIAPTELQPLTKRVAMHYRGDNVSPIMVSGYFRIAEFLMLAATGFAMLGWYVGFGTPLIWEYSVSIILASMTATILIEFADGYQIPALRKPVHFLGKMILIWVGVSALLALIAFFMKMSGEFSRVWLAGWFGSGLALSLVMRGIMSSLIRRWGRNGVMERRAVIVGGGDTAKKLIRSLESQADNDIRICGIFDDRGDKRSPPVVAGYPKLGTVPQLIEFARAARIDMLIVSLPLSAEGRVLSLLKKLWVLPVDIRLSAHSSHLRFRPRSYSYVGNAPMLDIFDRPITNWDSVAKRTFDIVFSLLGLIALSPIMIATAIAIKLESKGPVIFRQKRHGFNNEVIEVLKFRSMYTDMCDPTARAAVTKDDPRVTRVGRFIRKTSIDELPQFFNSLKGELSLVGPRPHAVTAQTHDKLYNEVVDGYFARHRVKPGVTGWAQINGWRGEIDHDDKIRKRTEFDLYYIENWSLLFDIYILSITPFRLLNTENAY